MSHDDNCALLCCQVSQGFPDHLARLFRFDDELGLWTWIHQPISNFGSFFLLHIQWNETFLTVHRLCGCIDHTAKKPWTKGSAFIKLIDLFCGMQESLLNNILRQLRVTHDQKSSRNRPKLIALDEWL